MFACNMLHGVKNGPVDSDDNSNDADLWLNLKSRLQKGKEDVAKIIGKRRIAISTSESEWDRDCIQNQQPVDDVVREWIRGGEIHETNLDYLGFFAARLDAAWRFIREFTFFRNMVSDPTIVCPFPFPKMELEKFLDFILCDWWRGVGCFSFHERFCELQRA